MIPGGPFVVTADYIGEYGGGSYLNLTCRACDTDLLCSINDKRQEADLQEFLTLANSHECPPDEFTRLHD